MDKLLSFQEKNVLLFSLLCKGVQEKRRKLLAIRGFTLLIRENNYEHMYMNPRLQLLVCCKITHLLKEIKMVKNDPKIIWVCFDQTISAAASFLFF